MAEQEAPRSRDLKGSEGKAGFGVDGAEGPEGPPAVQSAGGSFGRAALYGVGAAFVGFVLYSLLTLVINAGIGLIFIMVVAEMVGRAVRRGSGGRGGRARQILAITLTYFAITTSYIPIFFFHAAAARTNIMVQNDAGKASPTGEKPNNIPSRAIRLPGPELAALLPIALAAPFLSITSGTSGILTFIIIFCGLKRAWTLSGPRFDPAKAI